MSFVFEIRVRREDALRALDVLADRSWALELYGDALILALFPDAQSLPPISFAQDVKPLGAKIPQEWVAYKDQLRAIQCGPLWIGYERSAPSPTGQYDLKLITKDAFGTGLHETTLMCLQKLLELAPLEGEILDVGTGSGILALAALKFGAPRAAATEIDATSRAVAAKNAEANGFATKFAIGADVPSGAQFPVVTANIIAPVLLALSEKIAAAVAPGGALILSGLRDQDLDEVAARYKTLGLARTTSAKRGNWNRIDFAKLKP